MLKGIDVSHYQKVGSYGDFVSQGHTDFMFVKITEGKTYTDKQHINHINYALENGMLVGLYHYARPENNTALEEAKHFVEVAEKTGLIGNAILALDYEGTALNYGEVWALDFLNAVYDLCGVKPVIYLSSSLLNDYKSVAEANYGLWVANWSHEPSNIAPWSIKALWQKRGTPLDLDIFYGSKDAWAKYSAVQKATSNTETAEEVVPEVEEPEKETEVITEANDGHCGCTLCEAIRQIVREELGK